MKMRKLLSLLLCVMMILSSVSIVASAANQVKNIIYLIPDGGGMDPFYLADAVKQAGGFNRSVYPYATQQTVNEMYLKDYLVAGFTTHSANYAVTDSAAGGTALSTGYKTNNYYIGLNPGRKPIATILEAAQTLDMRTGLVTTYPWAHATPASFSAHALDRYYYRTIAEQQINQGLDVVLPFNATGGYAFDEADSEINARGYKRITSLAQMNALQPGDRVWGNLGGQMTYSRRDITNEDAYPTLAEMTSAAITALSGSEEGFFLMVEGSAVDGGGHANNALHMVSEFIAFDEACKIAIEWAKNRTDTVVVAAPDHDTGGMNVKNQTTAVSLIRNGTNPSTSYITWDSTGHTARNGGIFLYKPEGVADMPGTSPNPGLSTNWSNYVVDNTTIAPYLADLLGVDLDEVTAKLFVDVTGMGSYTPTSDTYYDYDDAVTVTTSDHTGYFTFRDYDLKVVRNQSVATYNGTTIDMDGEVAVYSGGRFYVPQNLLDQLGIEVDNSAADAVSSSLTGEDLANNVIDSAYSSTGSTTFTLLQANYTKSYVTLQIGVPKTAYYDLQAIIDTSNRPAYGNVLYGTGVTATFDTGDKVTFTGNLGTYTDWVSDGSASVLLEQGTHTITFTTGAGANNIIFSGVQLVEDTGIAAPEASATPAPTPTATPAYDYDNITKENAPYAGVYVVESDKAVTLTNETGHTVTLAANTPAYFYMIKGNNNITMSDSSATLTFTALVDNGMDYIAQVNAGTTPVTSTHIKLGFDGVGNIANNVSSTYGNASVSSSSISIPNSSSATITVDVGTASGLYYMTLLTSNSGQYVTVQTDTGHYGQYASTLAGNATHYEDAGTDTDFLLVYLREGANDITIANSGPTTITVTGLRCSRSSSFMEGGSSATDDTIAQFVLANCKVIHDSYDPDAPVTTPAPTAEPTATPEPTPGIVGDISYTNAPYAGVYEVTSDKAVTLTNETGHTVTLAANTPAYFYMIKGNNNITLSDATATLSFTALDDNGLAYIDQVTISAEPITGPTDDHVATSGAQSITLAAGEVRSFTHDASKYGAGIYYPYISGTQGGTVKVSTDTGYYAEILLRGEASSSAWADGSTKADPEMVYLRDGTQTITIKNTGSSSVYINTTRFGTTSVLATATYWVDQMKMAELKVVPAGEEEVVPTPTPTTAPTATPTPTDAPVVNEGTMTFQAPYAGVYKVSSDKAVTLINETGHKVTLSAGGTGYYYMFKGLNTMSTSNEDATITFTALANNGMSYIDSVAVDHLPTTTEHIYIGFDANKDGGYNVNDFVYAKDSGVTSSGRYITVPVGQSVTLKTSDNVAAGLYYVSIKTTDTANNIRLETDTGYYGVWNYTIAAGTTSWSGTTHFEDCDINGNGIDFLWVYLKEGTNYLTLINNGDKAFSTEGIRPSRSSTYESDYRCKMSNATVIIESDVVIPTPTPTVAPTATPTPTPAATPDGAVSYTAPYAGVYAVTADAATTVTSEIGSTVTLAAGETKYIYLLKGANILTNSANANLTFTALINNGLDYLDQVTADIPLAASSISELVLSGNYSNAQGSVTDYGTATGVAIEKNASVDVQLTAPAAGLYVAQIQFVNGGTDQICVSTDTGFYGIINQQAGRVGWNELYQGTHGVGQQDLEILFLREGVNTITLTNTGASASLITKIKLAKTGSLSSLADYNWQLNVENLKVIVDEHKYTDFALDAATATASVNFTKGNEADEVVSLIIAEYDETTGKLLQVNIEYIDTSAQAKDTTVGYSVSLTGATGILKAMLMDENLAPKATAIDNAPDSSTDSVKFSILGDSISTFNGYSNNAAVNSTIGSNAVWYYGNNNDVTSVDQTWWKQVADETGMEVLVNNSYSGDKVCVYGKTRALQLHNNDGETPDVIAVYLGTNDFANGCTLADFTVNYPAMIASITETYPDADVYLLNLLYYGSSADAFCGVIEDAAATYGCTYVDIRNDAGFTSSNVYDYMADDYNVHPGSEGMTMIANCVVDAMSK